MLHVVCWKWNRPDGSALFSPVYVNRLRAALARHCRVPHRLTCVTETRDGLDPEVGFVPLPTRFQHTPRCRRRMQIFDRDFASAIGPRIVSIDLDVVIVDDITPLVTRPEPLVCWKVGHAGVFSGSFLLMDAGVLHGLWQRFAAQPEVFPRRVQRVGVPSDQAMLNWYVAQQRMCVPFWTEADGLVTYYGAGYERLEHRGVGPNRPELPPGARMVVLGSADKQVMDEGRFDWIRTHWGAPLEVAATS